MKAWIFPILVIIIVIVSLALIYFKPDLFIRGSLISPLADSPNQTTITPNPLSRISTPAPVIPITITVTPPLSPTTLPGGVTSITLTGKKEASDSAKLLWTVDGQSQAGFIVLHSTLSAPVFPPRDGDQARSTYDSATRQYTLTGLSGTVFIRVCELVQNACGTYSNQISLEF